MPRGRAAGPDKIPAETYRYLLSQDGVLATLFSHMLEGNETPAILRRSYTLPFDKAGKDHSQCAGKRTVPLLNTFTKLLEAVLARLLKMVLGAVIANSQRAYRRQRSAELLLAGLGSFARDSARGGEKFYMVGWEIEGAFDNANLWMLVRALGMCRVHPVALRFLGNWLTARSFRLHFRRGNITAGRIIRTMGLYGS